jgi:hypothetical protein
MLARTAQIVILVSAGLLLFIAAQWPRLTIPASLITLLIIGIALRRLRNTAPEISAPAPRNTIRRVAGIAIAAALLLWALLSLRRG